jgi:hypothetical protein
MNQQDEIFDIEDGRRLIGVYSKEANEYGNCAFIMYYKFIKPVSLAFLQRLFNVDPNDLDNRELIDCYDINQQQAEALQPYIEEKLELDKYYYMLKCKQKHQVISPRIVIKLLNLYLKKGIDNQFLQTRYAEYIRDRDYFGDFVVSPGFDKPNAAEIAQLYEPMWRIIEEIASPATVEELNSFKVRQYIKMLKSLPTEHYL